ncbi:MAG: ATP-binding protein [Bacteroidales bacterium]|jgi:signal transduction histidine kinase|nr:ATP-binding protein [Bacteroidales bacterium]
MNDSNAVDKKLNDDLFQLHRVFSAIREISSQMIREENEEKIIQQACNILKKKIGYDQVYIALANQNQTQIGQIFSPEQNELSIKPNSFYCYNEIVQVQSRQLFHPRLNCFDCYLKDQFANQERLIIPLKFQNNFYGMVCIISPEHYKLYVKEQELLESLARDIAYTLFNLEVRRDHAKIRKEITAYYKQIELQNKQLSERNHQLSVACKKAGESDTLKSSFLRMISHELRTPLNGILGFTQLIKSAKIPAEKVIDYVEVIHQSGIQLLQVINNLLEISKIESGQLTYHESLININHLFDQVIDSNQYYIENSGKVDFIIHATSNQLPEFFSDREKLKAILNVLVSNALKFTSEGVIEVGCLRRRNNKLQFYVKDTGIGIEKDKAEVIFQNFRQSDESVSRKYGGTGLGLSIAAGLVDFLNGEIWFESEVNLGSIFYFTIPVTIVESD